MFGESVGKMVVKLIIWLNWFNVGVGLLFNLTFLSVVLNSSTWLEFESPLRDFITFNRSFINHNGFYLIPFVTGLILMGIWLNVLLTNAVEKCDEQNFLTWFTRTALWTILEWGFIAYVSLLSEDNIRFIIIFGRISAIGWIYIILRIIYPVVSYLIIFRKFFYVHLYFRCEDYNRIQIPSEV